MGRFCSNCGAGVQEAAKFCAACGQVLTQVVETPQKNPQPQAQQPHIAQQAQAYAPVPVVAKKKSKPLFIIAGAVVAAAALATILIVTNGFGLIGEKNVSVTAAQGSSAAPTERLAPVAATTPAPSPVPPQEPLWVDETKPNPNALFRLGMTHSELTGAIAQAGLVIADEAAGYIDAPPVFFGLEDGRVTHISWDVLDSGIAVPTANGFTARSTVFDLEQAMGRPLAACAEDDSIMYLYHSGNQYVEVYFNWDSPYEISGFCVEGSMENLHANPEYDDYDTIQDHITGRWAAISEEGLILLHSAKGKLAPDMPEWSFVLYGKKSEDQSYFESIVLMIRDKNGQEVDSDVVLTTNGTVNDPHILLQDVNFDGYLDVLYTEGGVGAHENYWYNLRLWDADNESFHYTESFNEICNPAVDAKDKVIRSCGAGSAFEDIYSVYVYKNGVYYLDSELVLTYDEVNGEEHRTYEVYSFDTGKAKLVKKSKGSGQPNPNNPGEADFWGPKSTWKLDDPIWYQSRHFQGSDA